MPEAAPPSIDFDMLPAALRPLAARGRTVRYRKGALLIQEGELRDEQFIVLTGRVRAYSTDERDREIVYGTYGPGEYLGEMSLDGGPRSASVVALEPTSCVMLTRQSLREHIAAEPDFAFELIGKVIHRARMATRSARSMALLDVYGRVAQLLDDAARPLPDGTRRIDQRLTHQEIAAHVGCSREMVSRLMKDLEAGDYIGVDAQRRIHVRRPLPHRW